MNRPTNIIQIYPHDLRDLRTVRDRARVRNLPAGRTQLRGPAIVVAATVGLVFGVVLLVGVGLVVAGLGLLFGARR
jgi:Flp pilus assembly protein TadB